MLVLGQRVRVRKDVTVASEGVGGHVGMITGAEPVVDEEAPENSWAYRVLFNDPKDQGWIHWQSDTWLNDYEIEAL